MTSKYVLHITSQDTIDIKEYKDYQTINDLVGGWYELCGFIDNKYMLYCNEEFLYEEKCQFNALATIINGRQPIFGDTVLLLDGYTDEGERDSVPLLYEEAAKVKRILESYMETKSQVFDELHSMYDNAKPKFN